MPEGTEAGKGESESPAGPARGADETGPRPGAGPGNAEEGASRPAGAKLEGEFPEDLPTLPPEPGRREAALRWAMPEQSPVRGPGVSRPFRKGPPALPERGQPSSQPRRTTRPSEVARPNEVARPSVVLRAPGRDTYPPGPGARAAPKSASPDLRSSPGAAARIQGARPRRLGEALPPTPAVNTPKHPSRRGNRVFWLLAVVILVAASAVAAIVLRGGAPSHRNHRSTLSAGEILVERLLATSATAQQLTARAVARSCAEAAPGGTGRTGLLADLSRAIEMRQSVLQSLDADKAELLGVAEGSVLMADLSQATTAELTLARDYQGWLQDLQATGCYSAPTNDIHYRAAGLEAPIAAAAEQRMAVTWANVEQAQGSRP